MDITPRLTEYRCSKAVKYLPEFLCYFYPPEDKHKLPYAVDFNCGALFIDVKSFTTLTEQASAKGHYGVEIITGVLNSYYELINTSIRNHGGEIAKFAGDAVLALFFGNEASSMAAIKACGEAIEKGLIPLNRKLKAQYGFSIGFHGMANWGGNKLLVLGDSHYHLDYIIYGNGLRKLFQDDVPGNSNEIVLQTRAKSISSHMPDRNVLRRSNHAGDPFAFLPVALREAAPRKRFSSELRNVAILFIRLDVRELKGQYLKNLDKAFRHIQDCVYRFEGIVRKVDYNEKGLVVICTFGIPVAHLNDVQRAVFAARAIMGYQHKGIFRIGITYSNIYNGLIGSTRRYEYGIIGSGVNAAARLMMEADPDEILVSSQILPHVEVRFSTQYLKKVNVKGFPDPVEIHRITAEMPVSHHSLTKLFATQKIVAWQQELDAMCEACNKPSSSELIFVSGEPGTGKTFILWNLLNRLQQSGKQIAMLGLEEFNQATPYHLVHFILQDYFGIADPLSQPQELGRILQLDLSGLNLELLTAYFQGLATNHKTDFDRNIQQEIVFDQLLVLLNLLCSRMDTLVVDNLHWCDRMSLRLLQSFAAQHSRPCNLILTSRYGAHRELFAHPGYMLELQNLPDENARQLINHHLPMIADDATDYLLKLSSGNPLFITELCRQIQVHQAQNRLITLADILALERRGALPHNIENLFVQRLTYFGPEVQYLLKLAAIVGKAFTLDELSIMDREKLQSTVLELLGALDKDNVISCANITPDVVYIFTNNLMREAIYNTILLSEKRDLHSQIALHYEARYLQGDRHDLEIMANHFILAEKKDKACIYSILAADRNYALSNYEEASYYYQAALNFSTDEEQKTELQLCLADAQIYHTELDKADAVLSSMAIPEPQTEHYAKYIYLKAKSLYLKTEYHELQELVFYTFSNLPKGHHFFLTMIFMADSLRAVDKIAELETLLSTLRKDINRQLSSAGIPGLYYSEEGFDFPFSSIAPEALTPEVHDALYYICKLEGVYGQLQLNHSKFKSATTHFRTVLALAQFLDDSISARIAFNSLANLLCKQGKHSSALRYYNKAKSLCEKSGDRFGYSKVIMDIGVLYRQQGNNEAALEAFNKSEAMSGLIGNKAQQENAIYNIGVIHYQEDRLEEAESNFLKALELAREISDNFGISYATDALGDLAMAQENLDKAESYYRHNLEFQKQIHDTEGIAHSLGNLGNIANSREDFATALDYYGQNLALCQEVGDLEGEGKAWFNSAMASLSLLQYQAALDKLLHSQESFHKASINIYDELLHEKLEECRQLLDG